MSDDASTDLPTHDSGSGVGAADDLSPGDAQDVAELLDSDTVGVSDAPPGGVDDPDLEPGYPPEHLQGADEYGLTAAEERVDEPIEERVERERPDPLATRLEEAARGVDPRADAVHDPLPGVGRLVEPGAQDSAQPRRDDEGESVAAATPQQDLSAEEAAVHRTDPRPAGELGDGYLG